MDCLVTPLAAPSGPCAAREGATAVDACDAAHVAAFEAAQVAAFDAAQLELAEVDQAERACSADEEVASPDGQPYIFSHI